jgi:hypothetical protein
LCIQSNPDIRASLIEANPDIRVQKKVDSAGGRFPSWDFGGNPDIRFSNPDIRFSNPDIRVALIIPQFTGIGLNLELF